MHRRKFLQFGVAALAALKALPFVKRAAASSNTERWFDFDWGGWVPPWERAGAGITEQVRPLQQEQQELLARQGECCWCGQCCGSETSPPETRDSPWPDTWPSATRTWTIASLETHCPIHQLVGHPHIGGDVAGDRRVDSRTYRFIWVPRHGLCNDATPWGDAATFEEQCPFLKARQPDGTYPCAVLDDPEWSYIYHAMCSREWLPPLSMTEAQVARWQGRHPGCSYTWA